MWDAIRRVSASQKPDGRVRLGNRTDNRRSKWRGSPKPQSRPSSTPLSTSVGSGCAGHSLPTLTDLISN